jgi:BTB/POZ domain-containing protein KCTD9
VQKMDYLNDFTEKYFNPLLKDKLEKLNKCYIENNELLKRNFLDLFCRVMSISYENENSNKDINSKFIFYSLIRTSMFLNKNSEYLIRVYSNNVFLDAYEYNLKYDANWAFKGFFEIENDLEQARKLYVGKISRIHVKELLYKSIDKFAFYMILLARQSLIQAENSKINSIYETKNINIVIGDYVNSIKDISNTNQNYIFKKLIFSSKNISDWFEKNKNKSHSCFFQNLDISNYKLVEHNFSFSRFEGCTWISSNVISSNFEGGGFINCDLLNANFFMANIVGSDFSGNNLQGAAFNFSNAYSDENSSILGNTNLRNTNLRNTNFKFSDLRNAVFINANLEDTNFTGANLRKAIFSKEMKESQIFSAEQKQNIIWI